MWTSTMFNQQIELKRASVDGAAQRGCSEFGLQVLVHAHPMHLAEQRWRHAETSLEGLSEAGGRGQADVAGNGLERQALGEQRPGRLEPQALDEVRRRLAGGAGELAIEAALGEARARGERRHIERLVEVLLHPFNQ